MKNWSIIGILLCLALLCVAVSPIIGHTIISPEIWFSNAQSTETLRTIVFDIRFPRVVTAFLAGSGLALSGMVFQAMFRNTLATPFTLGVASGASLGAAIYFKFIAAFTLLGISGVSIFAFSGALLTIFLVYGITASKRDMSTSSLLLAGIAISYFFSSLILLLQFLSDMHETVGIIRWTMGGLETYRFHSVLTLLPFVLSGTLIVFLHLDELNLIATGEDIAISRGVDVKHTKFIWFFGTSLMVGGIVSECGPIGFVGMMVPHMCRLLVGANHRWLAPATFLFGGIFLILCDTLARSIMAGSLIPTGIVTALLGGPFFIWLLLKSD